MRQKGKRSNGLTIFIIIILVMACSSAFANRGNKEASSSKNNSTATNTMIRYSSQTSSNITKKQCSYPGCNTISYDYDYCSNHRCVYGGCLNQRKSGGYAYCTTHIEHDWRYSGKKGGSNNNNNSSSVTQGSKSGSYSEAADYDDPEDFYADYEDEFDSYEDAEDEWEDWND